jgi:hypothetical protein
MKYMIQVRFNGADVVIHALPTDEQTQITAEFQAVRTLPGVLDGSRAAPRRSRGTSRRAAAGCSRLAHARS